MEFVKRINEVYYIYFVRKRKFSNFKWFSQLNFQTDVSRISLNFFILLLIDLYYCLIINFKIFRDATPKMLFYHICCTYPAPAVGKKTFVLGPIVGIHIKQARRHNEDPYGEIDGIQYIIEHQRLLHTRRH